jgi:hypothetical protein
MTRQILIKKLRSNCPASLNHQFSTFRPQLFCTCTFQTAYCPPLGTPILNSEINPFVTVDGLIDDDGDDDYGDNNSTFVETLFFEL